MPAKKKIVYVVVADAHFPFGSLQAGSGGLAYVLVMPLAVMAYSHPLTL